MDSFHECYPLLSISLAKMREAGVKPAEIFEFFNCAQVELKM
jgi:hypothetical protein